MPLILALRYHKLISCWEHELTTPPTQTQTHTHTYTHTHAHKHAHTHKHIKHTSTRFSMPLILLVAAFWRLPFDTKASTWKVNRKGSYASDQLSCWSQTSFCRLSLFGGCHLSHKPQTGKLEHEKKREKIKDISWKREHSALRACVAILLLGTEGCHLSHKPQTGTWED